MEWLLAAELSSYLINGKSPLYSPWNKFRVCGPTTLNMKIPFLALPAPPCTLCPVTQCLGELQRHCSVGICFCLTNGATRVWAGYWVQFLHLLQHSNTSSLLPLHWKLKKRVRQSLVSPVVNSLTMLLSFLDVFYCTCVLAPHPIQHAIIFTSYSQGILL